MTQDTRITTENFRQLDAYLQICRETARDYGIKRLFVGTGTADGNGNSAGAKYTSRELGKDRDIRVLTFTFYPGMEIVTARRFVPPSRAVRLTEEEVYVIEVDYKHRRSRSVQGQIYGERVDSFGFDNLRIGAPDILTELRNAAGKLTPHLLLRSMVGMCVFGVDEFFESEASARLKRALEKT